MDAQFRDLKVEWADEREEQTTTVLNTFHGAIQ